jgi:hypothetical protein
MMSRKVLLFLLYVVCAQIHAHHYSAVVSEPNTRPTNLTLFGDYLFWRPVISSFPYAAVGQATLVSSGQNLFNVQESIRHIDFDFKQGFRIGGAYQYHQGWQVVGAWTRLWATGCSVDNAPQQPWFILSLMGDALQVIGSQATAEQRVKFDQLNVDLQRELYVGDQFECKAFFGPVVTRIKQRQNTDIVGTVNFGAGIAPTTVDMALRNDFTGGGLRVGCAMEYQPISRFSIFGAGSYGVLAGKFKIVRNNASTTLLPGTSTPLDQDISVSSCMRDVVNVFDLNAGIKCTCLLHEERTLEAHLGYQFLLFPGQVRIPRTFTDFSVTGGATFPTSGRLNVIDPNGNVSFNGVTLGLVLNL